MRIVDAECLYLDDRSADRDDRTKRQFVAAGARLERVERHIRLALINQVRLAAGRLRGMFENLGVVRDDPAIAETWTAVIDIERNTIDIAIAGIPCRGEQCLCQTLFDQARSATERFENMLRVELARAADGNPPSAEHCERKAHFAAALRQLDKSLAGVECVMTYGWRWR